jgi:hypothetical protein
MPGLRSCFGVHCPSILVETAALAHQHDQRCHPAQRRRATTPRPQPRRPVTPPRHSGPADYSATMERTLSPALSELIQPFIRQVAAGEIEVYNEFSLQHELGIFLRYPFPHDKVQFERNVRFFSSRTRQFIKREIDISIFSPDKCALKWAIELKYPRNGQHPEQMFSFCKDILFAEQLKAECFVRAGSVIVAEDPLFWEGASDSERVYRFFRGAAPLCGTIRKPTGAKDETVQLSGSYSVEWKDVSGGRRYAVIEAV